MIKKYFYLKTTIPSRERRLKQIINKWRYLRKWHLSPPPLSRSPCEQISLGDVLTFNYRDASALLRLLGVQVKGQHSTCHQEQLWMKIHYHNPMSGQEFKNPNEGQVRWFIEERCLPPSLKAWVQSQGPPGWKQLTPTRYPLTATYAI